MKWNDPSLYPAENPYNDGYTPEQGPDDTGGRWDDPVAGGGTSGACPPGTFPADVDSQGKRKEQDSGDCIDSAEAARRSALWSQQTGIGGDKGTSSTNGTPKPSGPAPPYNPGYKFKPVPQFEGLPDFQGPTFQAPSFEDAMNDPGYKFAVDEGRRARDASAAARGTLRTGAQARSLDAYGQNMGAQQYSNVYGRRFGEHVQDYGQKFGEYGQRYRQALDMYSPKLAEWSLLSNAEIGGKNIANQNQWSQWQWDNLSASQLLQLLQGL